MGKKRSNLNNDCRIPRSERGKIQMRSRDVVGKRIISVWNERVGKDSEYHRWRAEIDLGSPPIEEVPLADDTCTFCGRRDESNVEMGTEVLPCKKCEKPVCNKCAETDFDCVGDPPQFQVCQWDCPDCIKGE